VKKPQPGSNQRRHPRKNKERVFHEGEKEVASKEKQPNPTTENRDRSRE